MPNSEKFSISNFQFSRKSQISNFGFTLIELLVVITILGILATIGLETFTSSQARARDAERKSDLKQIANSLELFYSDYGQYPASNGNGQIEGCPSTSATVCAWGTGDFRDVNSSEVTKTTYFQALPKDPASNLHYYYNAISVSGSANQAYQLFAHLENSQDQSIITTTYSCGSSAAYKCNFSITSANITPASTPDP